MKSKKPTELEKRELEKFDNLRKQMLSDGYIEEVVEVSTLKLNLIGLAITAPLVGIIYGFYWVIYGSFPWFSKFSLPSLLFLAAFIVGVIVHEFVHGFTWSLFCKNRWKSIRFEFVWDYLMPCCICSECISQFGYVIGLLMPITVLGLIPCVLSFVIANHYLMLFSLAMILCGGGDIYFSWKIRTLKNWILVDHPITRNCIAFKK